VSRAVRGIVAVGGLALLAVLFVQLGPSRILALLEAVGWNFPVIVAIYCSHEAVRALALRGCLLPGDRVPLRRLVHLQLVSEAVRTLTHTGQFVSEPARAWILSRQGIPASHAFAAAVSEVIVNSCVSALLTVGVLGTVLRTMTLAPQLVVIAQVILSVSLVYVLLVVTALVSRTYVIGGFVRLVSVVPWVARLVNLEDVRRMEDAILHVLRERPAALVNVTLLEVMAQGVLILEVYWTIHAMGLDASVRGALLVEALTKLVNGVQFVGATEGGYALILGLIGMPAAVGFTLSLVKRMRSLVVSLAVLAIATRHGEGLWPSVPHGPTTVTVL
jgi:hypothetical protein